jgi:hypothetical protein
MEEMVMPFKDCDRKRQYDRERMARLYAAGRTWWQRHPDRRIDYDFGDMRPYLDARPYMEHSWRKRPVLLSREEVREAAKEAAFAIHKELLRAELARIDEEWDMMLYGSA